MKKRLFLSVVAVTAIAVGYQKYNQSQTMTELMLVNVQALASGEDGTNVETCYVSGGYGDTQWVKACDSKTSTSRIYPCPSGVTSMRTGATNLCTK